MIGPRGPLDPGRGGPQPVLERRTANMARFYDAMLQGKDNFAEDRELARRLIAVAPSLPRILHLNRRFVVQAMRQMAGLGVTQFLDLGCGLPSTNAAGQVRRGFAGSVRVVHVDHDPVVVAYGRAHLAEARRTAVVHADMRDADAVFAADETRELVDPSRPVGVLLTAMLHHFPDADDPRGITRSYMDRLPSRSMLAFSHFHAPDAPWHMEDQARCAENMLVAELGSGWFRSRDEIAAFAGGLDPGPQGVRALGTWTAGRRTREPPLALCGLAMKP
ncbi:SAM-dependent methyltransferase [Spirillospora sp. CA-142024]|uniref:SAM-dependent methyltransferase n=1 Tax=Spirillospora sp. CA-142024 TaxID=3240036 RepID=UPI003D8CBE10